MLIFKRGWAIILCVFIAAKMPVLAQQALVKASVDKQKILLGEPLMLTLEIRAPATSTIQPFKVDSISHFEFLKKDSIVKEEVGGAQVIRQYFLLTSFDSGRWVIPPLVLTGKVKTAAILVDVVFTSPFDPDQAYHDIQDIREVPFKLSKKFEKWWYLIALLLILITLLIYWLTEEKKPGADERKISEGAYGKALRLLQELKGSKVPENKFYARLVEIFRGYLLERTGIDSLQQTSGDLVEKIKPLFSDLQKYESLSQVLSLCDLVKFAKYNPDDPETKSAYEIIVNATMHIEENSKRKAALKKTEVINELPKTEATKG